MQESEHGSAAAEPQEEQGLLVRLGVSSWSHKVLVTEVDSC